MATLVMRLLRPGWMGKRNNYETRVGGEHASEKGHEATGAQRRQPREVALSGRLQQVVHHGLGSVPQPAQCANRPPWLLVTPPPTTEYQQENDARHDRNEPLAFPDPTADTRNIHLGRCGRGVLDALTKLAGPTVSATSLPVSAICWRIWLGS
jgi:hypothetical protein